MALLDDTPHNRALVALLGYTIDDGLSQIQVFAGRPQIQVLGPDKEWVEARDLIALGFEDRTWGSELLDGETKHGESSGKNVQDAGVQLRTEPDPTGTPRACPFDPYANPTGKGEDD